HEAAHLGGYLVAERLGNNNHAPFRVDGDSWAYPHGALVRGGGVHFEARDDTPTVQCEGMDLPYHAVVIVRVAPCLRVNHQPHKGVHPLELHAGHGIIHLSLLVTNYELRITNYELS